MYRLLTCITLFLTLLISACTPSTTAEPLPTLERTWTIEMTHSGGIAGLSRSIEVSSDGSYIVADNHAGTKREGRLGTEELEELKVIVASVQYVSVPKDTGCADCFVYDIAIAGTGRPFKAHLDDVTLEESGLGPLVMALRTILEREL